MGDPQRCSAAAELNYIESKENMHIMVTQQLIRM